MFSLIMQISGRRQVDAYTQGKLFRGKQLTSALHIVSGQPPTVPPTPTAASLRACGAAFLLRHTLRDET